jgi:hypothetical protein
MIRTATTRRSASTHPTLLTPAFLAVTLASLAYFTGDGVLIPAAWSEPGWPPRGCSW